MKPFNQLLHNDILKLKSYTGSHNEASYKQLFRSVLARHKISRPTLYKELSKDVPGSYKPYESRGRAVPICQKEAEMVKDMLSRAKTSEEIRNTMSIELGFSYSVRRLNRVKQHIKEGALLGSVRSYDTYSSPFNLPKSEVTDKPIQNVINKEMNKEISHEINIDKVKSSMELSGAVKKLKVEGGTGGFVVNFKGNLRKLFYRLSMLSKMDPAKAIKLNIYGYEREVSPRTIKSCLDHIASSASTGGMDTDENIRFNIQTILLNESNDYKRGFYIKPSDIKSLESARRSLAATSAGKGGTAAVSGGYSLEDVYEAVSYFSPGARRDELINYFKMKNKGWELK